MTTLFDPAPILRGLSFAEADGAGLLGPITGTSGDDTLVGTGHGDEIHSGSGDDLVSGRGGDDTIFAGHGKDTVDGGAGDDIINGDRGGDSLFGGAGDDFIMANPHHDPAMSGNETVDGGAGDDTLYGSFNRDQIDGGGGDDTICSTPGADRVNGGAGVDTFVFDSANAVQIDLGAGKAVSGPSVSTLTSIENASGGGGADLVAGGGKANVLAGGDGDDTLAGGGGDDSLHGDAGGDRITGGLGADVLEGGDGADVFVYAHTVESDEAHADLIVDLETGDRIDLSAIDADRTRAHDQAFHLAPGLTGDAGQLAVFYDTATDTTLIEGDVDGDASADLVIKVSGKHTNFTDFVL